MKISAKYFGLAVGS